MIVSVAAARACGKLTRSGGMPAATRYPPEGTRGACPCVPSAGFGTRPWSQSPRPHLWTLIESPEAAENIGAILSAGPDAVVLGPFDLSMSMGLDGDFAHLEVRETLSHAAGETLAAGIDVVHVAVGQAPEANADGVVRAARAGCRIATTLIDRTLLAHVYRETVRAVRVSMREPPVGG